MKLGFEEAQTPYTSSSQSARAWTEQWLRKWGYCPNCGSGSLNKFPNNQPLADFSCLSCGEEYELKSQKHKFGPKVMDGAFYTKCARLAASNNPNLFLLNYDRNALQVQNLFVVPKHFFVRDIIEERKPLTSTARRAGWIGSNILLSRIPEAGKIFIVQDGQVLPRDSILDKWKKTLFLRDQSLEARGWLIEVMKCIEAIGRPEFELQDVYAFESALSALYPNNRHVQQKIRQQLQFLRDRGYLDFISRGRYRLRNRI
jgi:type II restriction enzyme